MVGEYKDFFKDCKTVEEVKKLYRKLAFQYHPDREGGDLRTMQVINSQYQEALSRCDGRQQPETGQAYTYDQTEESLLAQKIDQLLKLRMKGVDISLVGSWVWVYGDTRPYKETLKGIGFMWAPKKGKWYFHTGPSRRHWGKGQSWEHITSKYGETRIED